MKYTLLDMTQTIASSMDSDEVNSISDSVESLQIAYCIRTAYFDILSRANLPEHYTLFTLTASGSASKPTLMTLPDTVSSVVWLKYNKETADDTDMQYQEVFFKPLDEFLDLMYNMRESETNIGTFAHTFGADSINVLYYDDRAPSYYTVVDDYTLLFDSYDSDVDTTLQSSKTLGWGKTVIPFSMVDGFTPDLDDEQFPLLLNEAKALAWAELRQAQHPKAEVNARRGWSTLQNTKSRTQERSHFDQLPNFGRHR